MRAVMRREAIKRGVKARAVAWLLNNLYREIKIIIRSRAIAHEV